MNNTVSRRRIIYICAIVALVMPLYLLGHPSVRNEDGSPKSEGGTLAQIRHEYNLGQGDLGEIDPASESMRLATLGLRGVAATILWQKAEYYKKEKYWDRLAATLNQIAVLQPHFIKVWEFQGHNLSYNVSHEFDDYRQRYQWVKRGIDYLIKGSKYNKNRTEMQYELGWFFGSKMGVADEKLQYRELFRNDEEFHEQVLAKTGLDLRQPEGRGPDQKPDNWKSGRLWYETAYDMVAGGGGDIKPARSTMQFYRMGPQWLMKYSEAIQKDGYLGDDSRYAWRTAGREWQKFGERQIVTTFGDTIFLTELQTANEELNRKLDEFKELTGETWDRRVAEVEKTLSEAQRSALAKEYADRDFNEVVAAQEAEQRLQVDPTLVAKQVPDAIRIESLQRAKELVRLKEKIRHIEIYRNQINYPYWTQRCIAEQEDAALAARSNMYEAEQLLEKGQLDEAFVKYEAAWEAWDDLFNTQPAMMIDEAAEDVIDAIERYRRLLDSPELPEDFKLAKFLEFREIYDEQLTDPALMSIIATWPVNYPDRNFLDEMLEKSEQIVATQAEQSEETAATATAEAEKAEGIPGVIMSQPATGLPPIPIDDEGESSEKAPDKEAPQAEEEKPADAPEESQADAPPAQPESTPEEPAEPEAGQPEGSDPEEAETSPPEQPASEPQASQPKSDDADDDGLQVQPPAAGGPPVPKKP